MLRTVHGLALAGAFALLLPQVAFGKGNVHLTFDTADVTGATIANLANPDRPANIVGGASFVDGFIGDGALSLDGTTGFVQILNQGDYQLQDDFSWGAWIRTTAASGTILGKWLPPCDPENPPLAQFGDPVGGTGGQKSLIVLPVADGPSVIATQHSRGQTVAGSIPVNDGEWHHVFVTINRDHPVEQTDEKTGEVTTTLIPEASIYVDGILDLRTDINSQEIGLQQRGERADSTSFRVGDTNGLANGPNRETDNTDDDNPVRFTGEIDDVWLFEGALSEAQVVAVLEGDAVDCAAANDTSCAGVTVTPPADGFTGQVSVSVEAADGSGDDIWYHYKAIREEGDIQTVTPDNLPISFEKGPVQSNTITFPLPAGTYTIEVRVVDDLMADGASCSGQGGVADDVCTSETFVINRNAFGGRRVSANGGGVQYWYDSEDFDEGFPPRDMPANDGRTFDNFFFTQDSDAAFGKYVSRIGTTNPDAVDTTPENPSDDCRTAINNFGAPGGELLYSFDISQAGGEEGNYIFWYRTVNPSNTSDFHGLDNDPDNAPVFEIALGALEDDPATPQDEGGLYPGGRGASNPFNSNANRIFERTIGPDYQWDNRGGGDGHTKRLADGVNRQIVNHRQGGASIFWDVWCWTDDVEYIPTDADYKAATQLNRFTRGDCNSDGGTDLSDGVAMLNQAFLGGEAGVCADACDFNASGSLDITTAVFFFNALFLGGAPIRAPLDCDFGQPLLGCADVTEGCPRTGDVLRPVDGV
jgi:hypothetical protein